MATGLRAGLRAGEFYTLVVRDERYRGRICEALSAVDDRWKVRVLGVGTKESAVHILVHSGSTKLVDDTVDECPVCMDPLCTLDVTLMCGHRFHAICFDEVRKKHPTVSCPMCRGWAGQGGDFKMDWAERPAYEVLASCLACVFKSRHANKSIAKASDWAMKRLNLMAKDVDGRETLHQLVLQQQRDRPTAATKGIPFAAKFPLYLASALAHAIPSEEWAVHFWRFVPTLAPGQAVWAKDGAYGAHLTAMLQTPL